MFIGKRMFQFQESKLLNEIAGLPDILKDRDLYNGKKFVNVPDAATPREAVIFKTTGVCKPGILSPDFAKALARAAMVETGVSCGAYGWNTEVCIGEWRCNTTCEVIVVKRTIRKSPQEAQLPSGQAS